MKNFWKHIISLKDIIKKSADLKHMNFLENIVVMKLKLIKMIIIGLLLIIANMKMIVLKKNYQVLAKRSIL